MGRMDTHIPRCWKEKRPNSPSWSITLPKTNNGTCKCFQGEEENHPPKPRVFQGYICQLSVCQPSRWRKAALSAHRGLEISSCTSGSKKQATVDGRNPANQLIWRIYHVLQGFIHIRWCRISSINSMSQKINIEPQKRAISEGLSSNHYLYGTWGRFQAPSWTSDFWGKFETASICWDWGCVPFERAYGCFLKWWYPQNIPTWSFLVGKPMVVGYHLRKHPHKCGGTFFSCSTFSPRCTQVDAAKDEEISIFSNPAGKLFCFWKGVGGKVSEWFSAQSINSSKNNLGHTICQLISH